MVDSDNPKVAENGATWATANHLQLKYASHLFDRVRFGNAAHRKGVANQAAHMYSDIEHRPNSIPLLKDLFRDDDKEVRAAASQVFWSEEIYGSDETSELAIDFVQSAAFPENADHLLFRLDDYSGGLAPYAEAIFAACRLLDTDEDKSYDGKYQGLMRGSHHLFKLVLRLYELTFAH